MIGFVRRELLRAFPSRERVRVSISPYIFLITSTIRYSDRPLSYTQTRSVYSTDQRLEQTLQSIESVRTKVPGALVILLENSDISVSETSILQNAVDWFVSFAHDTRSVKFRDGPYKGAGELYMLMWIQEIVQHIDYHLMFKLSGRYWLSDFFCLGNFRPDKFGFFMRDNSHSTRLYCVPKLLEATYQNQLKKTFGAAQKGVTIESLIMHGVPKEKIQLMDRLGVSGYIAPTGELIEE